MKKLYLSVIICCLTFTSVFAQCNLMSAVGTDNQIVCKDSAIMAISYSMNATSATISGLPNGVTINTNGFPTTISGNPTQTGVFTYTISNYTCASTGTITVNASPTALLTSGVETEYQAVCNNSPISAITYSVSGSNVSVTGLPNGVNYTYSANTVSITGTPTVDGIYNYTVTTTSGNCSGNAANGRIIVGGFLDLSSGAASQTVCTNQSINTIKYIRPMNTTTVVNFSPSKPTGVDTVSSNNGNLYYAVGDTLQIFGTPSTAGIYTYAVNVNGCNSAQSVLTGTINVNNCSSPCQINLISAVNTDNQVVCINSAITDIKYSVPAASATLTGLPSGVNYSQSNDTVIIYGTPTVAGTYTYSVSSQGTCASVAIATGTITVGMGITPIISLISSPGSDNQTVCAGSPINPIVYSASNSISVGSNGILPGGCVQNSASTNTISVTGTPNTSTAGIYLYTVTFTGQCNATASATATITVALGSVPNVSLTSGTGSDNQQVCVNTAITPITYSTPASSSVTGLPNGVSYNANSGTISGTPTQVGSYPYTLTATGTCGSTATATGTITVGMGMPPTLTSAIGTDSQQVCINTSITPIVYNISTSSTITWVPNTPNGITYDANSGTISGIPTIMDAYTYTLTDNGTCGAPIATGTLTVGSNPSATAGSLSQNVCINTPIQNIIYNIVGNSASTTTLPTGVSSVYNNNNKQLTISGTPSVQGSFDYTVTAQGPCGSYMVATGTINVAPSPSVIAGSSQTIYNTNTIDLTGASLGGSAISGSWSVFSSSPASNPILSSTAQTSLPDTIKFTPEAGFSGTVVLALTANNCGSAIDYKTINIDSVQIISATYTIGGSYTWTVPSCINTITVQAWGGGGGGGGANTSSSDGGGGGGGAFSSSVFNSVTPGTTYNLTVGTGGTASFTTKGSNGSDSWFGNSSTVLAQGGAGGLRSGAPGENGDGGVGGQASAGYGQIKYSGGNGGKAGLWPGGGGGSSAGYASDGTDGRGIQNGWADNGSVAASTPGGIAPLGGGNGGNGANSSFTNTTAIASPGLSPGGGGGGGTNSVNHTGESGADGQIKILYSPSFPISISASNDTVCSGQSVTLTATAAYSTNYLWSTGATTNSIIVAPTTTSNYSVSDINGCGNSNTATITVLVPTLTSAVGTDSQSVCINTTITPIVYNVSTSSTITWVPNTPNGITYNANSGTISGIPTIMGIYTYTLTDNGGACGTTIAKGTITVDLLPTAAAGGSKSLCENQHANVQGASASNGSISWTENGAGSITAGGSSLSPMYSPATGDAGNAVILTMTVTSTNSCAPQVATATYTMNIDSMPIASVGAVHSMTVCSTNPIIPISGTTTNGSNSTWYTSGNGTFSPDNSILASQYTLSNADTTAHVVQLSFIISGTKSCSNFSAKDSVVITINNCSSPCQINLISAFKTDSQTICIGSAITDIKYTVPAPSATLTGLPSGVNYSQSNDTVTIYGTPTVAGTYTYSVSSQGTCASVAIATGTITVDPLPIAVSGGQHVMCENGAYQLLSGEATAANGTILWNENGTGSITSGVNTLTPSYSAAAGDAGNTVTLKMMVTGNGACSTQKDSAFYLIAVDALPTATAGGNQTICANSTTTVSGASATNGSILWTSNGAGSITSGANTLTPIYSSVAGDGGNTVTLTMTVTSSNTCVPQATTATCTINVNAGSAVATISGGILNSTNNSLPEVVFTGMMGLHPYTFNYTINGGAVQTISTSSYDTVSIAVSVATPTTYTYTLIQIADANGCGQVQHDSVIFTINPLLDISKLSYDKINVKVFPNPFSNDLKVVVTEKTTVKITDVTGQLIYTAIVGNGEHTIETSNYSSGLYFISFENEQGIVTKKMIKN